MHNIVDYLASDLMEDIQKFFERSPGAFSENAMAAWRFIFATYTSMERSVDESVRHIKNLNKASNPMDWLVSAALFYANSNFESAAWSSAICFRTSKNILAFRFVNIILMRMKAPEGIDEYLKPRGGPSNHYRRLARSLFYSDKMDLCDHYLQRRLALKNHVWSQIEEIKDCRESDKRNEREFPHETLIDAERNYRKWAHSPNKQQLAFAVSELMFTNRLKTCLELGSHAGALLVLIKDFFATWEYEVVLAGIEPDPCPFELSKEKLPDVEFHLGNHELLKTWDKPQDVLLCSFVCLLCNADEMVVILDFARRSAKYIVIADDLSNMFNDRPRIRRHYLIHPLSKLLSDHGFEIADKIFLEDPNEAANGILIGRNLGL